MPSSLANSFGDPVLADLIILFIFLTLSNWCIIFMVAKYLGWLLNHDVVGSEIVAVVFATSENTSP